MRYIVGWTEQEDWDRHDGDFIMKFEGFGYASIAIAGRHADLIAISNPDYVFIVLDDDENATGEVIKHVARRVASRIGLPLPTLPLGVTP